MKKISNFDKALNSFNLSPSTRYFYRIMPLKYVVDMFETRELHFASPTTWADPYEQVLRHRGSKAIFAQCWCKRAVSDAMWRIYSPDRSAVRIRSSKPNFATVATRIKASFHATFRLGEVTYGPPKLIDEQLSQIAIGLRTKFTMTRATDALFLKRDAFDYEHEVRALVFAEPQKGVSPPPNFRIRIDPHAFIESILFDPRADATYVKMASHYLNGVLGFQGPIGRSVLYRADTIDIPDQPD